ncbi:exopolysaccharide biosynthesis protein [Alsobacter sp. R-9]
MAPPSSTLMSAPASPAEPAPRPAARLRRNGVIQRSLLDLAEGLRQHRYSNQPLTLGDAFDRLGQEGLGLALLILTLPALIPIPGPVGLTFGTLTFFIGLQVLLGLRSLWLPGVLRRRELPAASLRRVIAAALPWLRKVERHLRESRFPTLAGTRARVLLAAPVMALAIIIALPIPFGNFAPAVALIAFAVGFLARDGLAVLAGVVLSGMAFGWTAVLLVAGAEIVAWTYGLVGW